MAVLEPMKILALDEHTAALDPKTAAFILELTREIVEENHLTALMVTHSMHQALELGNRTVMLDEGRVVFDVRDEERKGLTVPDLLDLFHKAEWSLSLMMIVHVVKLAMTYVVTEACIKCKYTDCVEVCPVDCFYEGENMLVINPEECIDCGVCHA